MRELNLNGYIDDEVWWGDEITPAALHESLYGQKNDLADDVHIRLNSYGGSCNAATRMYDDLRAYPGKVHITVSGTAASAATVLVQAADVLDITPGSLFMIHDPSTAAYGNVRDLMDAIRVLEACKESILNVYQTRSKKSRSKLSEMMTATTWMDAREALENGLVDAIAENPVAGAQDAAAFRTVNRADAEKAVQAWYDRQKNRGSAPRPFVENSGVLHTDTDGDFRELRLSAANLMEFTTSTGRDVHGIRVSAENHVKPAHPQEEHPDNRVSAADKCRRLMLLK